MHVYRGMHACVNLCNIMASEQVFVLCDISLAKNQQGVGRLLQKKLGVRSSNNSDNNHSSLFKSEH